MDFRLFIPITKVDAARRLVYGTVAEEIADKSGEIMDYASARPEFESWSADIAKASDGRSLTFDDDKRRIEACGKIVDDGEWQKVLEGVYTGFSMGGKYLKRWPDSAQPELTRYTPRPMEISLVDSPCIPTATFQVVKEDGSTELRKFARMGARHSAIDLARVQALHDTAVALGAACDGAMSDDIGDNSGDNRGDDDSDCGDDADSIDKRHSARAASPSAIAPRLDAALAKIARLESEAARLGALPVSGGPVLRGARTVTKGQDRGEPNGEPVEQFRKHLDTLSAEQRARVLMKFTLANPLPGAPGR
jgi:hypothetical protein